MSRVQDGVINRDARFGYIELATTGFKSPSLMLDPQAAKKISPPSFISVSRSEGISKVKFAVEMTFDLPSGKSEEWQRCKICNLE